MIKLIPVIDILNGQVVRGIAGKRDQYQPNQSKLVDGSDPVETAQAFIENFNVESIYIADLNALSGSGSSTESIEQVANLGVQTVVDAAATTHAEIERLFDVGIDQVVIPLESLATLSTLSEIVAHIDANKLIFSLDLKSGEVMGPLAGKLRPLQIIKEVYQSGILKMIVLDLAGVGVSAGVPTMSLCSEIKSLIPDIELWTGGGVRSIEDLEELNAMNMNGVLVASALHDGYLSPSTWQKLRGL